MVMTGQLSIILDFDVFENGFIYVKPDSTIVFINDVFGADESFPFIRKQKLSYCYFDLNIYISASIV